MKDGTWVKKEQHFSVDPNKGADPGIFLICLTIARLLETFGVQLDYTEGDCWSLGVDLCLIA